MGASINKVMVQGRLGNDPEVRYLPNGTAVANITVATSERWKDKSTGEQKEKTEWHRIVLWGKAAEIVGEHMRKGDEIYVEGQLETRKWTDAAGVDKYTTEIKADVFKFGQKGPNNQAGAGQQGAAQGAKAGNTAQGGWGQPQQPKGTQSGAPAQSGPAGGNGQSNEPPMDFDDDIPF